MSVGAEAKAIVWSVVNDTMLNFETTPRKEREPLQTAAQRLWLDTLLDPTRVLNLHDIGVLTAYVEAPGWHGLQSLLLNWATGMHWSNVARVETGYSLMGWLALYPGKAYEYHPKGVALVEDMLAHYPSTEMERLLRHLTFLNGEMKK